MMKKKSFNMNVDPQKRILEFNVGDVVVASGGRNTEVGRVTAIYPRIAYMDVEFSVGNVRVSAEEVLRVDDKGTVIPPSTVSTPGHPTVLSNAHDRESFVHRLMHKETFADVEGLIKGIKKSANLDTKNKAIEILSFKFLRDNPITAGVKIAYAMKKIFNRSDAIHLLRMASTIKSYKRSAWKIAGTNLHEICLEGSGVLSGLKLASIYKHDGVYLWKMGSGKNMIKGACTSLKKAKKDINSLLDFTIYKKGE